MGRKRTATAEQSERNGETENQTPAGPETVKLSIVVSKLTYGRIQSALQRDRDYRGRGTYFLVDAVENELIRSETRAYSAPIGLDRRINTAGYDIPGADKPNSEPNASNTPEEKF